MRLEARRSCAAEQRLGGPTQPVSDFSIYADHYIMTSNIFQTRRHKIHKMLRESGKKSALVLSSNPYRQKSNDTKFPYRPNSDLFYLTGSLAEDVTLVITSENKTPLLIGLPPNPVKDLWEGRPVKPKSLATALQAEFVQSANQVEFLQKHLSRYETVYTQAIQGTVSYDFGESVLRLNALGNEKLPRTVCTSDPFMSQFRLFKSKVEIEAIVNAAEVTGYALSAIVPMAQAGHYEYEIGASIDYIFRVNQGEPAFQTIVGTGPSAATLHYHALSRKLRDGELLLIDCGAEVDMYAADITRTLPVGGKFGPAQRLLYETVLNAQLAAIKKIRHGVKIREVYLAAADVLTRGLIELNVLKGKTSSLLSNSAYKPWFPHGIGHSLGLDVHDIGDLRGNNDATLQEGMVFTVEPGLYFPKPIGKLPACGVRIEDDVYVTKTGCQVLTDQVFPKHIDEVEALFS